MLTLGDIFLIIHNSLLEEPGPHGTVRFPLFPSLELFGIIQINYLCIVRTLLLDRVDIVDCSCVKDVLLDYFVRLVEPTRDAAPIPWRCVAILFWLRWLKFLVISINPLRFKLLLLDASQVINQLSLSVIQVHVTALIGVVECVLVHDCDQFVIPCVYLSFSQFLILFSPLGDLCCSLSLLPLLDFDLPFFQFFPAFGFDPVAIHMR